MAAEFFSFTTGTKPAHANVFSFHNHKPRPLLWYSKMKIVFLAKHLIMIFYISFNFLGNLSLFFEPLAKASTSEGLRLEAFNRNQLYCASDQTIIYKIKQNLRQIIATRVEIMPSVELLFISNFWELHRTDEVYKIVSF